METSLGAYLIIKEHAVERSEDPEGKCMDDAERGREEHLGWIEVRRYHTLHRVRLAP